MTENLKIESPRAITPISPSTENETALAIARGIAPTGISGIEATERGIAL